MIVSIFTIFVRRWKVTPNLDIKALNIALFIFFKILNLLLSALIIQQDILLMPLNNRNISAKELVLIYHLLYMSVIEYKTSNPYYRDLNENIFYFRFSFLQF